LAKNDAAGQKNDFFRIFFLLFIYSSRQNFFDFTKISYLQPFREIMGGGRKSVTTTTTNERTTTNDDELHGRS